MKRVVVLLMLSVMLSGCTFGTRVYTNEEEATSPSIPEMEMVVEKYYTIQEINREYADGSTEQAVYKSAQKPVQRDDGQLRVYNSSAEFYENDRLVRTEAYEVDNRANVICMVPDGDETQAMEYRLSYDEEGNITEKTTLSGGHESIRETFLYNENAQVTEHREYEGDTLISRTVTEYGENGWRTAVTKFDGEGNVLTRQECTADEQKYSETVLEYDGNGALLRRMENGYDIGKNLVTQEVFDPQGNFAQRTYWRYLSGSHSYLVPAEE